MKRNFIVSLLICISLKCFSYNAAEINRFKAVFNEFPKHVPTSLTVDAPIAGNGDIGLTMAATDGKLTFYVGKNDFWKAIPSYPRGHVALPGALEISSAIFHDGVYHAEQLPGTAEINAEYTSPDNILKLCSWVSALDNKIIIELETKTKTTLHLKLWATEGDQSTTDRGTENGCQWVSRSYENIPLLEWPSHIAMALNSGEEIELQPNKKKTLVLAVYTNHDTEQWKQTAIREAVSSTSESIRETKENHRKWWEEFWALSGISMDDAILEKFYYQLIASNGRVIASSNAYSSKDSCLEGYKKFVEVVYDGQFLIFRDKNYNFQFKLYNKQKRLIIAGEVYDDKQRALAVVDSIKKFAKNAKYVEDETK